MVGAVDQWDVATATYADNFPAARKNLITGTLSSTSGAEIFNRLGKIDLLIASPECTHHSLARGNRPRCAESQASGLYILKFIEDLEPDYIVLENVAMMRHWDGYEDLYSTLEHRYGYKLRAQVLDAADFGVPQNRKRLFIFGSRHNRPAKIKPSARKHKPARSILDPIDKWPAGPLDNGRRAAATLARVQHGITQIGREIDFLTVYYSSDKAGGYQSLDRPLRTLTTLDRFGLIQWQGQIPTLRMLQVPELKRAMGLPQKFLMRQGTRRDRVRLIGNGVCPPVMKAVVGQLIQSKSSIKQKLELMAAE